MKSFRLDRDSVHGFLKSIQYVIVLVLTMAVIRGFFGWHNIIARISSILLGGLFVSSLMQGKMSRIISRRYPSARCTYILIFAMTVIVLGILTMAAFPNMSDEHNLMGIWSPIAFAGILVFVIINRKNMSVMR